MRQQEFYKRSQQLGAVCRQGIKTAEEGRTLEAAYLLHTEALPRMKALFVELAPLLEALRQPEIIEGEASPIISDPSSLLS